MWQILLRTPYDTARPDKVLGSEKIFVKLKNICDVKVGIVRLMNKAVFKACFPLHEGRHDADGPQGEKSDRRVKISSFKTDY